jgi:tetratricopeptide (TPR) repeat protein
MSDGTEHLIGLRGKESSGPRWAALRELNNAAARLAAEGRYAEATPLFEEAYAMTCVEDVDAAGLDLRGRVLGNLASMAERRGDTVESLRLAADSITACLAAEAQAGDRYGTVAVRVSTLTHRAQTLQLLGRLDEALADLDAALSITAGMDEGGDDALVRITLRNTRSVLLFGLERLEEAEAEARATLDLAEAHDPRLAAHPYSNLAAVAQAVNEHDAAMEYLRLAEQIHRLAGDPASAALAVANQGRVAARGGDAETSVRLLTAAEQAFAAAEEPLRAAEIRLSRVQAVRESGGDPGEARDLLAPVIATLRNAGHATMLAEALALEGDIAAALGQFDEADASYLAAWEQYAMIGARYQLARVDMRRALAVTARAEQETEQRKQYRLLQEALALSLPSALATDAIRHRFAPGHARERWAATVAVPAMAHALTLATMLQDGALISELLEHMSATVSLHAPGAAPAGGTFPPEPLTPQRFEDGLELSYTASALITGVSGDFPAARFALPPRLLVNPGRPSHLEPWIQETERRYGFPIRSDQVVRAW